ncbi:MAG TPA: hypothetical protein VJZ00_02075 [Thermoanaerobaculia bacterium]|nr:hypothetical protein [Thermoanaerobaculia bacterium]
MKALRAFVALLAIASAAAAAWKLVLPRYDCNHQKAIVNSWTVRLDRETDETVRIEKAREMIEICRRCLEQFPDDYELYLLLGSNETFLREYDDAEQSFRRSLALSERPETYAYLALAQLEEGKADEARKNLYRAALFNLSVVELVSEPMRSELAQAVTDRHRRLGSTDPLKRRRSRRFDPNDRGEVP